MLPRIASCRGAAALLACCLSLAACGGAARSTAEVSGHAFNFGGSGGRVAGGLVTIVERPSLTTRTDDEGAWSFHGLPVGESFTFLFEAPGRPALQTATLELPPEGLARVSLQSPDDDMLELMRQIVGVEIDPTRCQIASTVTRLGNSLYDTTAGSHGEPDATVTMTPPVAPELGPIYFRMVRFDWIYPSRKLTATSHDGGVLFVNVPPGEYELHAHKAGATIRSVRMNCRAGLVVNAGPPWGLQVTAGGVGPRDPDREF